MSFGRPDNDTGRDPWRLFAWLCEVYDAIVALQVAAGTGSRVTVALLAGGADNRVQHGLPGVVQSWEVIDKNANADVWRSPTTNPDRAVILLRASAAVTVKLQFK